MKKRIQTLCFLILGSASLLQAADYKVFPSYILEARDAEDQLHPMVGVADGFPQIVMEREVLTSPKRYVRVKPTTSINDISVEVLSTEEEWKDNALILNLKVKSSDPLEQAYAVLVFTPEGKDTMSCKYDDVGDLSGEPQDLRLRFNTNNLPKEGWSLRFYQSGLELYNPANPELKDATPLQAFSLALGRHIAAAGTGDANPAPFYMPIPAPDPSMLPAGDGPVMIKVKMEIMANGTVDNFMFPDDVSPELQIFLTKRLGEWRFLPRIKDGQRVHQTVVLPVKLR